MKVLLVLLPFFVPRLSLLCPWESDCQGKRDLTGAALLQSTDAIESFPRQPPGGRLELSLTHPGLLNTDLLPIEAGNGSLSSLHGIEEAVAQSIELV